MMETYSTIQSLYEEYGRRCGESGPGQTRAQIREIWHASDLFYGQAYESDAPDLAAFWAAVWDAEDRAGYSATVEMDDPIVEGRPMMTYREIWQRITGLLEGYAHAYAVGMGRIDRDDYICRVQCEQATIEECAEEIAQDAADGGES